MVTLFTMKHVLHILEAVEGGAWRHLQDLVGTLHEKGCECSVVLSFERNAVNLDSARSFLVEKSVPLYEIPMKRGAAPGDMTAVLQLIKLLRCLKPDLLHAHSSKAGILGRMAAKLAGVPAVYTPHCFPFLMKNDKLSRAYGLIEKGAVKMTSSIIVISRQELEAARSLGYPEGHIHYIPNGIKFCGLDLPEICDKGTLKLGFFGRTDRQKGADTFVRLVKELNTKGIKSEGSLFGTKDATRLSRSFALPLQNSLKGNIREGEAPAEPQIERVDGIRFCELCPQDQVIETMRSFDVIVMPSRWEGFPYVLLETLDAGVPLCAYNVGGIADVVEHGVSAMLTESEDFEGLLESVVQLRCAELRREIAVGGREAVKPYTLQRMAESTLGVYEKMINAER